MTEYTRLLEHLDRDGLADAGGKGANLGELIKAGLPVPPGFVVTARAYRTVLEAGGLRDRIAQRLAGLQPQDLDALAAAGSDIADWIRTAPVPEPIRNEVLQGCRELAARVGTPLVPVAVRSSATAEDLPSASFAGQQETFLHVAGEEAVMEHVRKCWASLWTPQAVSYRAGMGFDHLKVDLAVVVQAMVPADVAGVMFTANPVSGARDEILISASYGLGESVVSGAVTPDTFLLGADGAVRQRTLGSKESRIVPAGSGTRTEPVPAVERNRYCLTEQELAGLADLARRVQAHYGSPQDTEWAAAGGKLYLLQARPITTMAASADAKPDDWDPEILWKGKKLPFGISDTMEHNPEPPTPFDSYQFALKSFNQFFTEVGMRMPVRPGGPVERRDGRVAITIGMPSPSIALLWKLPAHLIKTLRDDPFDRWRPVAADIEKWMRQQEAAERKAKSATDLARLAATLPGGFEPLLTRRFSAVFFPGITHQALVSLWVRRALGKESAKPMMGRLLRALPFRTALQNQALSRLARVARAHGLESSAYKAAFQKYLDEYGRRPARGMIPMPSIPTMQEEPALVLSLVKTLLNDPADMDPEAAFRRQESDYQAARVEVEAHLGKLLRRWFRTNLERTRSAIICREESLFVSEGVVAFHRRLALKLGTALVRQGLLKESGDIFFLFIEELEPAANGAIPATELQQRIDRRKRAFAKVTAANARGQHWLITTGSIPPVESHKQAPSAGAAVTGLAASRGEAVGTVCVVRGPQEFSKLKKGDILVAPFTAPVWTPLFRVAAAVVTDVGSPVSHAAIVAREYGMPAVVATGNATAVLKDGQRVRVDGTSGRVTIIG